MSISLHRTGETIYSAEHLYETENKITEDISEKNKPNLMLHGLSLVLKCVAQQNLFFSGRSGGEKSGKLEFIAFTCN